MKKILGAISIITISMVVFSGCSVDKNTDEDGEKITVESLKQQVDTLTEQVNSMQEVMDRYYAGSKEGEQTPTYKLEDVTYETVEEDDRVLVVATNNGTEPVIGLKVLATFYDSSDAMLASRENYIEITVPGASAVAEFDFVDTDFGNSGTYDHVDIELSEEPYSFTRTFLNASDFVVTANKNDSNDIIVKVENDGEQTADMIQINVLFYKSGEIVGYNTNSMINLQPGNYDTKILYGAYAYQSDGTTQDVEYDDFDVMISSVYNY